MIDLIHCVCPHCNSPLRIPKQYAGVKGKCKFCDHLFVAPTGERGFEARNTGYGLAAGNPIMTGMGPNGANRYLEHLRCPNGTALTSIKRRGSTVTYDDSYIQIYGGKPDPRFGKMRGSDEYVNVDIYEVECGCNQHKLRVFVDMYNMALDRCIGEPGWTFVHSLPHGKTLQPGEVSVW